MGKVDVEADASNALADLKSLEEQLEEQIPLGVRKAARDAKQNAEDELREQSSVATGTGINSLEVSDLDGGGVGVIGRTYLKYVDQGTMPHTPERDRRLEVWAAQNGWRVHELVEHIEEEGTKPHPWIKPAFNPIKDRLPVIVATHARRSVNI